MAFISNSKKYIFIHLHKCAGTSIEKALENEIQWNDISLGSTAYGEKLQVIYSNKFGLDKHSSALDIQEVVGDGIWESYYTFAFVRHPLDRLISLYEYFKTYYLSGSRGLAMQGLFFLMQRNLLPPALSKMPSLAAPFKWPGVQAAMTSGSFSEFIHSEFLESAPAAYPQFYRLADTTRSKLIVDYVGKVEKASEDWEFLKGKLGINSNLPLSNQSKRKYKDWREYYTIDDIDFAINKYKIDMDSFSYSV
mgnify:CR=1 FL=1